MRKRFLVLPVLPLLAIAACVGEEATPQRGGGLGEVCEPPNLCLTGLSCVNGICVIGEGGAPNQQDGSSQQSDAGFSESDAQTEADGKVEGGVQCLSTSIQTGLIRTRAAGSSEAIWLNTQRAQSTDSQGATVALRFSEPRSQLLVAYGFGFQIPQAATLTGVVTTIIWKSTNTKTNATVLLTKQDLTPAAQTRIDNPAATNFRALTLGGPNDLWQPVGIFDADFVNSTAFGVGIQVYFNDGSNTADVEVDSISAQIHYCLPSAEVE